MVRGEIEVTFLRSLCIPFGISERYCIDTWLSTACVRVCLLPPGPGACREVTLSVALSTCLSQWQFHRDGSSFRFCISF